MKRVGCSVLVTIFAVVGGLFLTAPSAGAAVTALEVSPGDWGQTLVYDLGCTYQMTASTAPLTEGGIHFFDNGIRIGSAFPAYLSGKATIAWTPTTLGIHELYAYHLVPPGYTTIHVLVVPCPGDCNVPHL